MRSDEELETATIRLGGVLVTADDMRRARRVERAIDAQGRPNLEGLDFIPLRSPDGSTWRIRVDNAGALSASKEVPS